MRNRSFICLALFSLIHWSCSDSSSSSDEPTINPNLPLQDSCSVGTEADGQINDKPICVLKGTIGSDATLEASKSWVLSGGVFVGRDNQDSATLTIEAGTTIYGQSGADFLVVSRGSKIIAEGTAEAPIVMTSAPKEVRTRGSWGGLILNGNAPINACADANKICEAEGEGSTGLYGGDNPQDSSGVLRYVRIEFAGFEITPDNELNGVAFQGVGAGTVVDYLQVHMNADDGVEFFGGTVNVSHLVLTGNKDDSMDWVNGWQGHAQYVLIQQYEDAANNGIEADNLSTPQNAEPRSMPILANFTMIGTSAADAAGGSGLLLRRGTGVAMYNSIVTGFMKGCLDIDDAETFNFGATVEGDTITASGLVMEYVAMDCSDPFVVDADDVWSLSSWFTAQDGNQQTELTLDGFYVSTDTNLPEATLPDIKGLQPNNYIGAFKDSSDKWASGWTTSARQ